MWNNVIVVSLVGAQSTRATNANAFAVSAVCNEVLCCRFACRQLVADTVNYSVPCIQNGPFRRSIPVMQNGYGGNQPCAPDGIRWDISHISCNYQLVADTVNYAVCVRTCALMGTRVYATATTRGRPSVLPSPD